MHYIQFFNPKKIISYGNFFCNSYNKKKEELHMKNSRNGYYIFVKSYKHPKTGKLMIASDYGKRAFRLWISK